MFELMCWSCGRGGRVAEQYAGRRVTCNGCRAVNPVPDPVTREAFVADWLEAIDAGWTDPAAASPTVEVECRPATI
jgi:hypothetical protein